MASDGMADDKSPPAADAASIAASAEAVAANLDGLTARVNRLGDTTDRLQAALAGDSDWKQLFEVAAQLKSAQPEVVAQRQKWEALPTYLKNSLLYHTPRDAELRNPTTATIKERVLQSEQYKQRGNQLFHSKDYAGAVAEYEHAYSIWRYVERKTTTDRKNGPEIVEIDTTEELLSDDSGSADAQLVSALLASILSNIALVRLQLNEYRDVIAASEAALLLEPNHPKALYRCAMGYAGIDDIDRAIFILQRATELSAAASTVEAGPPPAAPDPEIAKQLSRLVALRTKNKISEKKAFAGLFDRAGGLYDDATAPATAAAGATATNAASTAEVDAETVQRRAFLADYNRGFHPPNVATASADGKTTTTASPPAAATASAKPAREPDLARMEEAAAKFGVDLTDPRVQRELKRLQAKALGFEAGEHLPEDDFVAALKRRKAKGAATVELEEDDDASGDAKSVRRRRTVGAPNTAGSDGDAPTPAVARTNRYTKYFMIAAVLFFVFRVYTLLNHWANPQQPVRVGRLNTAGTAAHPPPPQGSAADYIIPAPE